MEIKLPRTPLAHLPTPVTPLERLTQALGGARVFIKRDDLTGLAGVATRRASWSSWSPTRSPLVPTRW